VLSGAVLLVDCEDLEGADNNTRAVLALLEKLRGMVLVTSREPLRLRQRPTLRFEVDKPSAAEQQVLWRSALGPAAQGLDGQVEAVVAQFQLGLHSIHAAGAEVSARGPAPGPQPPDPHILWDACRAQARPRLDDLALRLEP